MAGKGIFDYLRHAVLRQGIALLASCWLLAAAVLVCVSVAIAFFATREPHTAP
jgi:hypothetical protein